MAEARPNAGRLGATLQPGTILADRYRLEAILGAGAFGVVWQARHVHLETECAVKLFDPPPEADPQEASRRFLQEARVTARLKCPNVAQVFDYGVHAQLPFLVLELLRGKSLAGHLEALHGQGQRLAPQEAARIIRHVAEALNVAHAAHVVHRDLKPDNIFLVQEGQSYVAKVLDFGIAKWSTDAAPSLTTTRVVMGTAHYMSPEQFESARQVDHRADLWSLGVIAFECLTGQLPFPGETFIDVAFRVCKQGPLVASQVADVPAGFDAWFARATALGREYRFDSALEQARALQEVCASAPALAALPLPPPPGLAVGDTAPPLTGTARSTPRSWPQARAAAEFTQQLLLRTLTKGRRTWLIACGIAGVLLVAIVLWLRAQVVPAQGGEVAAAARPSREGSATVEAPSIASTSAALVMESIRSDAGTPTATSGPASVPKVEEGEPQRSRLREPPSGSPPAEAPRPARVSKAMAAPKKVASPQPAAVAQNAANPGSSAAAPPPPVEAERAASSSLASKSPAALKPPTEAALPPVGPGSAVIDAAAVALGNAARLASSCRPPGGPSGPGKARIVYSNDGEVRSVEILTAKFRDTLTGSCLRMVFRRAKIAPFKGEAPTYIKSFTIPEE